MFNVQSYIKSEQQNIIKKKNIRIFYIFPKYIDKTSYLYSVSGLNVTSTQTFLIHYKCSNGSIGAGEYCVYNKQLCL